MSPSLHDSTWWYGLGQGNGDEAKQKHSVQSVHTQPVRSEKLPGLTILVWQTTLPFHFKTK